MDTEGIVIKVSNNKAYVLLESLGYEMSAQFEKNNLEPVGKSKRQACGASLAVKK